MRGGEPHEYKHILVQNCFRRNCNAQLLGNRMNAQLKNILDVYACAVGYVVVVRKILYHPNHLSMKHLTMC